MEFKRYVKISSGIIMIFPIVLLVLAAMVWSQNVFTGIIYLAIGIIQLVGMVLIFPRIRKEEDLWELGNKFVQHNWIVLSLGLTGVAMFLAPFFTEGVGTAVPYVAFAVCLVTLLWSILNLYKAVKETKARLVV
jgi:hypothetical protein